MWTRLAVGDRDPDNGRTYTGPPTTARLRHGERIVVDEAGMLDQDTALALLMIADGARASVALVGDRAQLPAVGRGGVLDIAAQLFRRTFDMATVHRFTDPVYADLTTRMRRAENPELLFDRLHDLGLVAVHQTTEDAHLAIARAARVGDAVTAATNDEARALNTTVRDVRVRHGAVDDVHTTHGVDGLPIGAGDVIQTPPQPRRAGRREPADLDRPAGHPRRRGLGDQGRDRPPPPTLRQAPGGVRRPAHAPGVRHHRLRRPERDHTHRAHPPQ